MNFRKGKMQTDSPPVIPLLPQDSYRCAGMAM